MDSPVNDLVPADSPVGSGVPPAECRLVELQCRYDELIVSHSVTVTRLQAQVASLQQQVSVLTFFHLLQTAATVRDGVRNRVRVRFRLSVRVSLALNKYDFIIV